MMKQHLTRLLVAGFLFSLSPAMAQNTAPYWSLVGNSNTPATAKLGTTNNVSLRFYAGNVQRMVISYSSGYVGIGNTSLTHRLTVGGNGRFTAGLQVDNGGIQASNTSGTGMSVTGTNYGIYATSTMESGIAIYGNATAGGVGVKGYNNSYGTGVQGSSKEGWGIFGYSETNTGIEGQSKTHIGVSGNSINSYGVLGESAEFVGVRGASGSYSGAGVEGNGFYGVAGYTPFPGGYAGYFAGNVYATGTFTGSDRSLKQDITDMESALDIIGKLKPKSYSFKQDGAYKLMNLPAGKHYGLIAQEVEQVLPQLVKATTFDPDKATAKPNKPDATGTTKEIAFKALNYTELIPIVIRGMQEQQHKIEGLEKKVAKVDALEEKLAKLEALINNQSNGAVTYTSSYLEQNTPNPVSGTTTIRYWVPEASTAAKLVLTNAKGQVVKVLTLGSRGAGQVSISTIPLAAGTYNYTLWVDGRQADSKRLIVAK